MLVFIAREQVGYVRCVQHSPFSVLNGMYAKDVSPSWATSISRVYEYIGMVNTTSIVNVATALERQGKRVLLVDVNSTCNLTRFTGVDYDINERNKRKTMLDLLINVRDGCPTSRSELVREAIIKSPSNGFDFIPGDKWMRSEFIGICKHNNYRSFVSTSLETVDDYDYIIYDCAEFLIEEAIMCMVEADDIYAPISLEYFMSRGYKDTFELINYINNELKTNMELK